MAYEKLCLSAAEVSEMTGISLSSIRKLTRSGEVPHIKVGRRVLYPVAALEEWLNNNTLGLAASEKDGAANG